ncbi:DUF1592 domain-containing protein [Schlesneria sp.]|uniref:DUF1592 domain-containing protein n=1 Tax=Schlesneria sp. TaxID=2762018 RepID=UPI002EE42543
MSSERLFSVLFLGIVALSLCLSSATASDRKLHDFLTQHCTSCHNDHVQKGGINLDRLEDDWDDPDLLLIWSRVHDRVSRREMPPKSEVPPDRSAINVFTSHLAEQLTQSELAQKRSGLRRLNRVEYENTLSDLFGIRVSVKDLFPDDPTAFGFDTVGDVLTISSQHLEAYLLAADRAVREIMGPPSKPLTIDVKKLMSRDSFATHALNRVFVKTDDGGLVAFQNLDCPMCFIAGQAKATGTYRVTIQAKVYQTDEPLVMAVYGGDVIRRAGPVRLVEYFDVPPGDQWTTIEFEDYLEEGHTYRVAPYGLSAPLVGPDRFKGPGLAIGEVSVQGPLEDWPSRSRKELFKGVRSRSPGIADARKIFERLLPRAYRRQVTPEEIDAPLKLVQAALDADKPFEDAIGVGLKMVLCSPGFVLREEPLEQTNGQESDFITDTALASRLSYFLWSSGPDDELLGLGLSNQLHRPDVLRQQVERLLLDPKAERFVQNFTGLWLNLRDIHFTEPDATLFPEYDEMLGYSMLEETYYCFHEIMHEDRSVVEFVDADWSFLNERLATHYGLKGIRGAKLQHVRLPPESGRGGVLTQASVLKVTANGTSTSPIVRGVWILNNILGQPTPPPPPDIPSIEPDIRGAASIREQVKRHRQHESCAGCHNKIDPPGLALESFDPIGGMRKAYRSLGEGTPVDLVIRFKPVQYKTGRPVDPSGTMPDGRRFKDITEFKKILAEDKTSVATCLTEKLLTYSLGRKVRFSDREAVSEIVKKSEAKNYGFRSLIHEVVQSDTFRRW